MSSFSKDERKRIREGLIEAGREQFSRFGHERTRISDLTEAVDIADSTFYQFFDSKGELHLEVLRREQRLVAEEFEQAISDASDAKTQVAIGFEYFFDELESNPLYYELIVGDDIQPLHGRTNKETLETFYQEQFEVIEPHILRWTELDSFRIDDPRVMIGIFRMLAFTLLCKEKYEGISPEEFDEIKTKLVEALINGLFINRSSIELSS